MSPRALNPHPIQCRCNLRSASQPRSVAVSICRNADCRSNLEYRRSRKRDPKSSVFLSDLFCESKSSIP